MMQSSQSSSATRASVLGPSSTSVIQFFGCQKAKSGIKNCLCFECRLSRKATVEEPPASPSPSSASSSSSNRSRSGTKRPPKSKGGKEYSSFRSRAQDDYNSVPESLRAAMLHKTGGTNQRLVIRDDLRSIPVERKGTAQSDATKASFRPNSNALPKFADENYKQMLRTKRGDTSDPPPLEIWECSTVQLGYRDVPRIDLRNPIVIDPLAKELPPQKGKLITVIEISRIWQESENEDRARAAYKRGDMVTRDELEKFKIEDSIKEAEEAMRRDALDTPEGEAGRSGIIRRGKAVQGSTMTSNPPSLREDAPKVSNQAVLGRSTSTCNKATTVPPLACKFLDLVRVGASQHIPVPKMCKPYDWAPTNAGNVNAAKTLPAIFWSIVEGQAQAVIFYIFPTASSIKDPVSVGTVLACPGVANISIQASLGMGEKMGSHFSGYIDLSRPIIVPQRCVYTARDCSLKVNEGHFWNAWKGLFKKPVYGGNQYGMTPATRNIENPCRLMKLFEAKKNAETQDATWFLVKQKLARQREARNITDDDDDDDDRDTVVGEGEIWQKDISTEDKSKEDPIKLSSEQVELVRKTSNIGESTKITALEKSEIYEFSTAYDYKPLPAVTEEEAGCQLKTRFQYRDPTVYECDSSKTGPEKVVLNTFEKKILEVMTQCIGIGGKPQYRPLDIPEGMLPHEADEYTSKAIKKFIDDSVEGSRQAEVRATGASKLGTYPLPWDQAFHNIPVRQKMAILNLHEPEKKEDLIRVTDIISVWRRRHDIKDNDSGLKSAMELLPRVVKGAIKAKKEFVLANQIPGDLVKDVREREKRHAKRRAREEAKAKERKKQSTDVLQLALERVVGNHKAKAKSSTTLMEPALSKLPPYTAKESEVLGEGRGPSPIMLAARERAKAKIQEAFADKPAEEKPAWVPPHMRHKYSSKLQLSSEGAVSQADKKTEIAPVWPVASATPENGDKESSKVVPSEEKGLKETSTWIPPHLRAKYRSASKLSKMEASKDVAEEKEAEASGITERRLLPSPPAAKVNQVSDKATKTNSHKRRQCQMPDFSNPSDQARSEDKVKEQDIKSGDVKPKVTEAKAIRVFPALSAGNSKIAKSEIKSSPSQDGSSDPTSLPGKANWGGFDEVKHPDFEKVHTIIGASKDLEEDTDSSSPDTGPPAKVKWKGFDDVKYIASFHKVQTIIGASRDLEVDSDSSDSDSDTESPKPRVLPELEALGEPEPKLQIKSEESINETRIPNLPPRPRFRGRPAPTPRAPIFSAGNKNLDPNAEVNSVANASSGSSHRDTGGGGGSRRKTIGPQGSVKQSEPESRRLSNISNEVSQSSIDPAGSRYRKFSRGNTAMFK